MRLRTAPPPHLDPASASHDVVAELTLADLLAKAELLPEPGTLHARVYATLRDARLAASLYGDHDRALHILREVGDWDLVDEQFQAVVRGCIPIRPGQLRPHLEAAAAPGGAHPLLYVAELSVLIHYRKTTPATQSAATDLTDLGPAAELAARVRYFAAMLEALAGLGR